MTPIAIQFVTFTQPKRPEVSFYRDVHRGRMRLAATGRARRSRHNWRDCNVVPMCNGARDCAHCQSTGDVPRGYR